MYEEAVAIGVAAFVSGDEAPSDEQVRRRLLAGGIEPWLVERLVVFLPLAFGRRVLPGVGLSDEFSDGPRSCPLAEEPVFVAAQARARVADRGEIERIGLRSSEVDAVNQALHHGSRMEDLQCGPPALAERLPAAAPGDGGVPSPREVFRSLLAGHGCGPEPADARVFPMPDPHPDLVMIQVDFELRYPTAANGRIVESFAWYGSTWREAIADCVRRFEQASLHPLIALLDRRAASGRVEWERWEHPSRSFDLCIGPQLTYFSPEPAAPVGPLLDDLLVALRDEPLSDAVHAMRVFTCHRDGALTTNEVLLDGEPWLCGQTVVAAAPAPVGPIVGSRVFVLLVPTT